jgi:2-amino-4-hydroxy-6-hydroxymethyldihydropteridine diphosphokinase
VDACLNASKEYNFCVYILFRVYQIWSSCSSFVDVFVERIMNGVISWQQAWRRSLFKVLEPCMTAEVASRNGMILIALGANLPDPAGRSAGETLRAAVEEVGLLPGLRIIARSALYESAPQPPSGQPPYRNAALALAGEADPGALLRDLLAIEARFGRERGEANAARSLDLDLIAMGALVQDRPDPILPHPRMHQRAFVLRPLADVAPGWCHPVLGITVEALLGTVADQPLRRLPDWD